MKSFSTLLARLTLPLFIGLFIAANAQAISFTGTIKSPGTPVVSVGGATIEMVGNPSLTATSDGDGTFTISGLPSGTPFSLKISKSGYVSTYSMNISSAGDIISQADTYLLTPDQLTVFGNTSGKTLIVLRAVDPLSPSPGFMSGVAATYGSTAHPSSTPYTLAYDQGGTIGGSSTSNNGKIYITNVDYTDTVTVNGAKTGWTFAAATFVTHADGISFGALIGTQGSASISFTGSVKSAGNPPVAVSGALIEMAGNSAVNTLSAADGTFTVTGLPSGSNFSLKISASGFVPVYTSVCNSTSSIVSPRDFMLQTPQQVSGWGVTQGKSAIAGRVVDSSNPETGYVGGAVVNYSSTMHPTNPPYMIGYQDSSGPIGGSSTYASTGKFFILNVDDGDTITVSVSKQGWAFPPKTFVTHVDGISQGALFGTTNNPAPTIGFTGSIVDASPSPIPIQGATIELLGNSSISVASDASGNFVLPGLPSGTTFSLRISKTGFVPSYTANQSSTSDITSTRPYTLFTSNQISSWAAPQDKGIITGRVFDNANPQSGISGAVVTFSSSLHPSSPPYTVLYGDTQGPPTQASGTFSTGKYFIFNVDDNDTVTVTVSKQGWAYTSKTFITHVDGVSQGGIPGTATVDPNQFPLVAGWNFISFAKLPADATIASIFSGISSDMKIVWGFDNEQKVWKQYKPGASDNSLSTIEQGKGYWVYLTAAHTLDVTIWTAGSSQVHLYEGWNLVGYSGTNGANIIPSLSGVSGWQIAWAWIGSTWKADAANGQTLTLPPVSTFEHGRAYWIKMGTGASGNWNQ
jgi:hypothetical protein